MADEPFGDGGGDNVLDKYHRQKAVAEIKGLMDDLKNAMFDRGTPVKSIPMRPEWKKAWDELEAARIAHEIADRKHKTLKDYFWSLIHKDLDDMRGMHFNSKTQEIEIFDDIAQHEGQD